MKVGKVGSGGFASARAPPTDPSGALKPLGSSYSVPVGTRKKVNYAWIGLSQRKLWWKSVAVLTCKSIVKSGYRGERLIELFSSWFLPKFPSG